ncbi:MAG: spermidine synthase [Polyangiales bacterium]
MILALALALALLVVARVWFARPRVLARVPLGSGEVVVQALGAAREMIVQGKESMVWSREPPLPYVDALSLAVKRETTRVLVLGCGGGSTVKQLHARGLAIDLVERDAVVVALARRHFDMPLDARVTVHVEDASSFVTHARDTWDAAVVDVYGAMELPPELAGEPFFQALRERIAPGGRVAVNVVGALRDALPARVIVAMEKVFGDVAVVPIPTDGDERAPRNLVVLACRS